MGHQKVESIINKRNEIQNQLNILAQKKDTKDITESEYYSRYSDLCNILLAFEEELLILKVENTNNNLHTFPSETKGINDTPPFHSKQNTPDSELLLGHYYAQFDSKKRSVIFTTKRILVLNRIKFSAKPSKAMALVSVGAYLACSAMSGDVPQDSKDIGTINSLLEDKEHIEFKYSDLSKCVFIPPGKREKQIMSFFAHHGMEIPPMYMELSGTKLAAQEHQIIFENSEPHISTVILRILRIPCSTEIYGGMLSPLASDSIVSFISGKHENIMAFFGSSFCVLSRWMPSKVRWTAKKEVWPKSLAWNPELIATFSLADMYSYARKVDKHYAHAIPYSNILSIDVKYLQIDASGAAYICGKMEVTTNERSYSVPFPLSDLRINGVGKLFSHLSKQLGNRFTCSAKGVEEFPYYMPAYYQYLHNMFGAGFTRKSTDEQMEVIIKNLINFNSI